ncbi:hypothetical protein ACJRO7_005218 [Eucalyptus globulus]|uniref:Uncharacterized protein n=1 Tax=Eucalyptus globulus TaxID=34317 RepID=A0ABD3J5D5_EUCGL
MLRPGFALAHRAMQSSRRGQLSMGTGASMGRRRKRRPSLLGLGDEFASPHAMLVYNSMSKQEKEVVSVLPEIKLKKSNETEGSEMKGDGRIVADGSTSPSAVEARRKKIQLELDLNEKPPEDDKNDDKDYGSGNGVL